MYFILSHCLLLCLTLQSDTEYFITSAFSNLLLMNCCLKREQEPKTITLTSEAMFTQPWAANLVILIQIYFYIQQHHKIYLEEKGLLPNSNQFQMVHYKNIICLFLSACMYQGVAILRQVDRGLSVMVDLKFAFVMFMPMTSNWSWTE